MNNFFFKFVKERLRSTPSGMYVLFYTQMWELFGRFGIMSLLVLYLTSTFHLPDSEAFTLYSGFIALIFAMPMIGGILADRFLGARSAVTFGASLMMIGNGLMVIPEQKLAFLGLSFVTVGYGFFLPTIPPLISAIYEQDQAKRDAGFTLYYLGTNLGALLAPIFCGLLGQRYGWNYAFILSTLGMASGLVVFLKGQRHLRPFYKPTPHVRLRYFKISIKTWIVMGALLAVPLINLLIDFHLEGQLMMLVGVVMAIYLGLIFMQTTPQSKRHLLAILITILAVILFESFLGQGGTTLNLFINRIVDRHLGGFTLPASFFYALDPVFLLLVGPFLGRFWTRRAEQGRALVASTQFAVALALLACGFLVFWLAAMHAERVGYVSPLYIIVAYFLFPMGELCIVPISLSLVTKLAPEGKGALLVAVWMFASALSSYFTGQISKIGQVNFSIDSVAQVQEAAHIYAHAFQWTVIILLAAAAMLLSLRPVMKRLSGD